MALKAGDAVARSHEVEIRRQAVQVSRSAVEQTRAELVRAEAAAATSAPDGARTATLIRAPGPGRVLRVLRESAGPVAAGTPLLGDRQHRRTGDRPPTLSNGFHVNVDIEAWKGTDVLTIPSTALFRVGQDWSGDSSQNAFGRLRL